MKKILVTLVTLALLLVLPCALAEEVPAINWADADYKYLRAPMEEILVFMSDCSVKRNSKKFGN